ncbi:MAG: flap structure-specific endonuclease, partial [Candidatus Nanohalobium sp.]
ELIWMGILMGTDFNPDGIHGIGPKTALKLVHEYDDFDNLMEDDKVDWDFEADPEAILEFFQDPPVIDVDYERGNFDEEKVIEILVDDHDFSEDRVESGLEDLEKASKSRQSGLNSFT